MSSGRFRRLFRLAVRAPSVEDEVEAEIAAHLDQLTEWLTARGLSVEEARREAIRRFGDLDRFRRDMNAIDQSAGRRRRVGERYDSMRQDLVLAWRSLRRSPGYALVVIGTLGLALGANATMFGIVDRLLFQPPSGVVEPGLIRRVEARRLIDGQLSDPWDAISYPSFAGMKEHSSSFSQVVAIRTRRLSFGLGRDARPVDGVLASGDYFAMVGTAPHLGRFFSSTDDQAPAGAPVAVISYRFWKDGLGGEPGVVGRQVLLDGRQFEIIGIAPAGFTGTDIAKVDVWLPLSTSTLFDGNDTWRTQHGWQWLNGLVKLRADAPEARALADATRAYQLGNADYNDFERKAVVGFRSLQAEADEGGASRIAGWLYGVTLIVLLIACANIANVVLARGIARRSEAAVMQALGIPRSRVFRQLLVETTLVMSLGLVLGLVIARWGGLLVRQLLLDGTAFESDPVDFRVFGATAAAAIVAGVLASLWPMLRSTRVDPAVELHGAGRSTGGRSANRSRAGLLLVQTALCTALVVLAALFLKSIGQVQGLDLGIDPVNVSLVSVQLEGTGMTRAEVDGFYQRAIERVRTLPGVTAAGISFGAPFRSNSGRRMRVPGRDSMPRLKGGGPYYFAVGSGTIAAYGSRILEGRDFTDADRAGSLPVVIVSERTARTLWPTAPAIGKCLLIGADSLPCRQIVGVVADLHRQSLEEDPFFMYFSVLGQEDETIRPQYVVVRTDPRAVDVAVGIRQAFLAERPDLPFVQISSYREILGEYRRPWSLGASLLAIFGVLSLVIAGIGLYGVIAFGVSQRTRELGLRSALGAGPTSLLGSVIRGGLGVAVVGVTLGVAAAVAASSSIAPLLFRTRPTDPLALAGSATLVLTISVAAAWFPGRRAMKIDPLVALRSE